MDSGKMILKQATIGPMMNFVYLVGCAETREAAVVDPAWDVPAILKMAKDLNLRIRHILVTHGHPDHVNGLESMQQATGARIYIHSEEVEYMKEVAKTFGMSTKFLSHRSSDVQAVSEGDTIRIGKLSVEIIHTPGHSPGSQCFLVENCLLSGDTLFVDACGRVDMPGGDPEKMWQSLNQKLRGLGDNVILYPGHDYGGSPVSTIGEQKKTNPYMNFSSARQFLSAMM
jgi:glyoxylase-like metal-dependent hydrolase (beta-lactamase superfamily II)